MRRECVIKGRLQLLNSDKLHREILLKPQMIWLLHLTSHCLETSLIGPDKLADMDGVFLVVNNIFIPLIDVLELKTLKQAKINNGQPENTHTESEAALTWSETATETKGGALTLLLAILLISVIGTMFHRYHKQNYDALGSNLESRNNRDEQRLSTFSPIVEAIRSGQRGI